MPDWDAKYAARDDLFGTAPNDYVRCMASRPDFPGGPVLCLADGDGRNGTWLASRGLEVTAVDISGVATEKARRRDTAAGLKVDRITADILEWTPPDGQRWSAIFLIYLQSDPGTRQCALQLASNALRPGGWLVIEAFAQSAGHEVAAGPRDGSVLYSLEEIERLTSDLAVIEAFEGRTRLDEGDRHQGLAHVVRYTGRRR